MIDGRNSCYLPPAFKLTSRTFGLLDGSLKPDTASFRFLISMVPSNLYWSKSSRCNMVSMRSMKLVNCENTTARKHGSWSCKRSGRRNVTYIQCLNEFCNSRRCLVKASNLVEERKSFLLSVTSRSEWLPSVSSFDSTATLGRRTSRRSVSYLQSVIKWHPG